MKGTLYMVKEISTLAVITIIILIFLTADNGIPLLIVLSLLIIILLIKVFLSLFKKRELSKSNNTYLVEDNNLNNTKPKYDYNTELEKHKRLYKEELKKTCESLNINYDAFTSEQKEKLRKDFERGKRQEERALRLKADSERRLQELKVKQNRNCSYGSYSNSYSYNSDLDLNDKSALMKLGYNLGKSKEERQAILKNKAIPFLGKKKCIGLIEFQIKLKDSIYTKDYSVAISKWLEDIQFIKNCN